MVPVQTNGYNYMKPGNEYTGPKYKQMGCKSEYKSIGSNYIHGNCTHGML